jgi:hypothetical protein
MGLDPDAESDDDKGKARISSLTKKETAVSGEDSLSQLIEAESENGGGGIDINWE